jgi:predicted alpha/beta hydrolase
VTYDYRGIGESRPVTLNKFKAFMHEWGEKDMAGVINWISENYPGAAIFAVGHSVAGQVMGLAENNSRIKAMLLVASQSGYWGLWPRHQRYFIWIFWYVVSPFFSILYSYFPARVLGMGENLPAGVALEWASWGRDPKYILGNNRLTTKGNFKQFKAPIRFYSVARDFYAPEKAVDELMTFYENARTSKILLNAKKVKAARFGHFDFFREKFKKTLWQESADWFKEITRIKIGEMQ